MGESEKEKEILDGIGGLVSLQFGSIDILQNFSNTGIDK